MRYRCVSRALIGAAFLPALVLAQRGRGGAVSGPITLEATADRIFAQFNSTHSPGCAVGVRQNGRDVLLRGYGMANLENGTPITPATILESGSVAKQFTATAIFLLVKDGKLSLNDPVRKHIPELPEYPRPLLVSHLLSHTSGLREWSNLVAFTGWPRGTRLHTQQELLEAAVAQKSLNYPVGDYYSYTNTGFGLLTTIVERVSGKPFAQFSDERIFRPLGLANTRWRDDFTTIVPGRAQAYARRGNEWELSMPLDNVHGPGGLLTTVGDWLRWNDHLDAKTLGADVVAMLTEQARLTSGRTISYARGVTVSKYRGTTEIAHSGSTAGYSTYLARYPEKSLSIAVLCNAAGAGATSFTRQLVDAMAPELAPVVAPDTVTADPAAVAKLAGIYRSSRTHEPMSIGGGSTGGGRGGGGPTVRALRGGGWLLGNSPMLVEAQPDGTPKSLSVIGNDADTVVWIRAANAPWSPTIDQLGAFVGRYTSSEVNATWTVAIEGGRLVASVRGAVRAPLTPAYPDAFTAGGTLGTVWFVRDARGSVTEMHSGAGRVWDFTFTKMK
jgi:CubicO group peptidase (beta-lactamase class C family)